MKKRPNILYIFADQMRGDCLGVVNEQVQTPCLDRLASEGVTFTRCMSNSHVACQIHHFVYRLVRH